mmetsp:Transcript_5431/g.11468  ORF Transcript_5431/g.11468 Transcript_5431/m.11468 type:complete len:282 (+) Transcript_5431:148-993(+)
MFRQGGSKPPKQMLSKPCHRGPVHDGIIRTITTTRLCWTTTGVHNQRENLRQVVSGKDGDSHHFVDNKSPDSHHGGTSVVQLNGALGELGLLIEGVPAVVKGSVTEVSREFRFSGNILHDSKLEESNEGDDLANTSSTEVVEGGKSVADTREGKSLVVDITRKTDSGFGDKVSEDGKHGDTSVLKFDISETGELFFVTIGNKSKRIKESKRWLGSELTLEGLEGGGGSSLLGRGKGSSRGDKGGKDGDLHFEIFCCLSCEMERTMSADRYQCFYLPVVLPE